MGSKGMMRLSAVFEMLDLCAPGHLRVAKDHHWRITFAKNPIEQHQFGMVSRRVLALTERITSFCSTHILYVSKSLRQTYEALRLGPVRKGGGCPARARPRVDLGDPGFPPRARPRSV